MEYNYPYENYYDNYYVDYPYENYYDNYYVDYPYNQYIQYQNNYMDIKNYEEKEIILNDNTTIIVKLPYVLNGNEKIFKYPTSMIPINDIYGNIIGYTLIPDYSKYTKKIITKNKKYQIINPKKSRMKKSRMKKSRMKKSRMKKSRMKKSRMKKSRMKKSRMKKNQNLILSIIYQKIKKEKKIEITL